MSRRFQFSLKWMLGLATLASVVAALVAMDYVTAPVALVAMSAVVGIASGKSSKKRGVRNSLCRWSVLHPLCGRHRLCLDSSWSAWTVSHRPQFTLRALLVAMLVVG